MRFDPLRMAVAARELGPNIALAPWPRARHRIALDALTPNRCAAARHDDPHLIAPTARLRRSMDKDLAMRASPPRRPEA
jgi:hypothetical protein